VTDGSALIDAAVGSLLWLLLLLSLLPLLWMLWRR